MLKIVNKLLLPFLKIKAKGDVKKLSDDDLKRFLIMSSQLKSINHLPKDKRSNYLSVRELILKECNKRKII